MEWLDFDVNRGERISLECETVATEGRGWRVEGGVVGGRLGGAGLVDGKKLGAVPSSGGALLQLGTLCFLGRKKLR